MLLFRCTENDTVWRDGLWLKLWEMGVKGKMWHKMYEASRSAVVLEGEKSAVFRVWHTFVAYIAIILRIC